MNFNSNRLNVDHIIGKVRSSGKEADALQAAFNEKRVRRVEKAVTTRPAYIPLTFELSAAGKQSAYPETTKSSTFNLVILGFVTNNAERQVTIRRPDNNSQSFAHVGADVDLRLTMAEVAGIANFGGTGQRGVFYLPDPIHLKPQDKLTVEVFKRDDTPAAEALTVVLVGYLIYPAGYGEAELTTEQQTLMDRNIDQQDTPATRFLKHRIEFDANGRASDVETPPTDEPLLIRGVRSTLRNSTIEVGIKGEKKWTASAIPIWALAEYERGENYRWFERPVFLPKGVPLEMDITNATGDDADATDSTITWICETA